MNAIRRLILSPDVPAEYRNNFLHLILDIAWYGILAGSAVNFLNVYAARLGATPFQIGLLGATSALVNLIFAIPAGHWLEKQPIEKAVFQVSVAYRIGFLFWIPLPWLFSAQEQIWVLILMALVMGFPLTALGLGFNILFAASVPNQWRAYVAGARNVALSLTFMFASLGCGYLLSHIAFPLNYQIVFLIGAIGGGMSSFHLYFIRPLHEKTPAEQTPPPPVPASEARAKTPERNLLRTDIWRTPFAITLLVLLGFHLAQYLAIPLFPVYFVNELHLTDQEIGIGTAIFYLMVLLGSFRLDWASRKLGHKGVTGYGILGMALYPALLAISTEVWQYYAISAIGGAVWAMVGGALANYLLEKVPAHDRPSHLAWYTIILNVAVLAGSLGGPVVADVIGISTALILAGTLRFVSGLALLKWG